MIGAINAKGTAVYRAFCRAIHIEQHHIFVAGYGIKFLNDIWPQHLASQQHTPERQGLVALLQIIHQHIKKGRGHVAQVNAPVAGAGA